MAAFNARLAEIEALFSTDLRHCNMPYEMSALLLTAPPNGFGVKHGLALLALPGFAVENIATADLQAFGMRLVSWMVQLIFPWHPA
jgi:hypothetical protein